MDFDNSSNKLSPKWYSIYKYLQIIARVITCRRFQKPSFWVYHDRVLATDSYGITNIGCIGVISSPVSRIFP